MVYHPHLFFHIDNTVYEKYKCIEAVDGYNTIIKSIDIIKSYGLWTTTIIFKRPINNDEFNDINDIIMDFYDDKSLIFSYKKYSSDYEPRLTNRTENTKSISGRIVNII